ncbi:MAG: hypothetical protein MUE36_08645 [Acidimicrobiales bacterium]|jgi:hypothetical protein|nr:hypothetical protein [Acidimicrobiales bacterium]
MAADEMRTMAASLASASGLSLRRAYAERLRQVETSSLLRFADERQSPVLAGVNALADAQNWDEVQVAQMMHDRQFHPDVFGLSKIDQLRHYTFHVTKLAGLFVDAIDTGTWSDFQSKRLPDIAIFGVKLSTVCNERLPSSPVDELQVSHSIASVTPARG